MTVTLKTISVAYERRQNLGDFSSAHVGVTLWADVTDDQDLPAAMKGLREMARENVKDELLRVTAKNGARVESVFMGLPLELRQAAKAAAGYDPDDYDDPSDDNGHGSMPHEFGDQ